MTDDLVKRLRSMEVFLMDGCVSPVAYAAADRIEELEHELRQVIEAWDWWQVDEFDRCASVPADAVREARATLKGNR